MHYDLRLKLIFQDAMPGLLRLLNLPAVLEYLTVGFPKGSKALPDFVVRLVDGRSCISSCSRKMTRALNCGVSNTGK